MLVPKQIIIDIHDLKERNSLLKLRYVFSMLVLSELRNGLSHSVPHPLKRLSCKQRWQHID